MDLKEWIEKLNNSTAALKEQTERWRQDLGLPDPEPTELDLLLQKWKLELPSQEPEGEEPPLPEPRGEELPMPEPREEELPLPEPEGEEMLPHEPEGEGLLSPELEGKEVKSPPPPQPRPPPLRPSPAPLCAVPRPLLLDTPPPQPRPPPLRSSPAPLCAVPRPLLLDTLPVGLDLSSLDLEPRSLQNRSQFGTWFPAPLLPSTKTSLRCSQTSLELSLVTTSLPLGDWTSLHRAPAADLCPLLQPPVPRLSLRSARTNRWVPSSPVRGPYLAGPGRGPIHPRVRPWKRAKIDICGLEVGPQLQGACLRPFHSLFLFYCLVFLSTFCAQNQISLTSLTFSTSLPLLQTSGYPLTLDSLHPSGMISQQLRDAAWFRPGLRALSLFVLSLILNSRPAATGCCLTREMTTDVEPFKITDELLNKASNELKEKNFS
ncbi:UNVERIFIED_CONTAM: hypothetical protein FKN15_071439 [Acipenser sinensis]